MRGVLKFLLLFIVTSIITYSNGERKEFRGVWIATVDNINWPSKAGLTDEEQKAEYIALLDEMKELNMNAVIMQVRPTADRLYRKVTKEPWSKYLIGKNGIPPKYDPLQFFIDEAHKRGFEFHAWFNPFRITAIEGEKIPKNHIVNKNPKWIIEYNKRYYYDPGNPYTRKFIEDLIIEVAKKYNIDAIHMDDYFYPYPVKGKNNKILLFNDRYSYKRFGKNMKLDEWRRANTDRFIRNLNLKLKKVKPKVRFGVSPFGVWRNKSSDKTGSDTKAGIENYDTLYANTRKWIQRGWIDYIAPQIYWDFQFKPAQYDILVDWWSKEVEGTDVDLYIGQALYKIGSTKDWKNPYEIINQIDYNRDTKNVKGNIFYGFNKIQENSYKIKDNLKKRVYQKNVKIPN